MLLLVVDEGTERGRIGSLTLVGDSLNVGVRPALEHELRGWRLDGDSEVGLTTDRGIEALQRLGEAAAPVLAISLGTNDPQTDAEGFREGVQAVLELAGPGRCVIWPTVWRGGANEALNDVLATAADANHALRVVEWHEMVAEHPEWLAGDGVHASSAGYAARAKAIADEARDCLPERQA